MFVNWQGVKVVLAALAVVMALCALDLCCSSEKDPAVLAHVKHEVDAGRRESAIMRRDQIGEHLRDLRALNRRLVEQGDLKRSREVTRMIIDLERQYEQIDSRTRVNDGKHPQP